MSVDSSLPPCPPRLQRSQSPVRAGASCEKYYPKFHDQDNDPEPPPLARLEPPPLARLEPPPYDRAGLPQRCARGLLRSVQRT